MKDTLKKTKRFTAMMLFLVLTGLLLTVSCKTEVTDVLLNKTKLTLEVGETETLIATVLPKDADNKAVSWQSSNNDVAVVDNNGKVTAVETGTALITVTTKDGGKMATCTVTVSCGTEVIVRLSKIESTLGVGESETLIASVLPECVENKAVTWKSNNNAVTVDSNGKITAKTVGTALITATTNEGYKTATCTVTVIDYFFVDTLKGEWSWYKTYGGIGGNSGNNRFKSIIKILSQNEDGTINYEVWVKDTLFVEPITHEYDSGDHNGIFIEDTLLYKESFKIIVDKYQGRGFKIKLPHSSYGGYYIRFGGSKDILIFEEPCDDCYKYYYQRIK